ncbi:MAG TPA: TIGR03557 family F420-dependent LLM class oxidoreductase [Patescibacteria group bacterium]|nr:TIGR03557 family F420-dependent LLM class oxidoreductase [Patescibacteria group bacterium]
MKLGYHLSSEEHTGPELVQLAARAEAAGFSFAFISDHFHPWLDAQGQSSFVWTTIGGISQATKKIKIITAVTCPIIRIHPVIIAQAAATAGQFLPERFILGVGTGENLNEHVVGAPWPPIQIRQNMLEEAITIIRLLFDGAYVDYFGEYFKVYDAKLYSRPQNPPLIFMAATGQNSTRLAGKLADGFISTAPKSELIQTFSESGGTGKPKYGLLAVCYDPDEDHAKAITLKLWPTKGLQRPLGQDLPTPKHFAAAAATVHTEDLHRLRAYGPEKEKYLEAIQSYFAAGFDYVGLHQIGKNQEAFFRFCETEILPEFG